jgi:hypothetical protein
MFILFIFRRRKGGLIVRMGLVGRGVFVDFSCFLFLFFFFFNLVYKALRREMRCILFSVSPFLYMEFVDVCIA